MLLVCALAASAIVPSLALAQPVARSENGRISISANDVPVSEVLRELILLVPIEAAVVGRESESALITLEAEDLTPATALIAILEASGSEFSIRGGKDKPFRVYVGSAIPVATAAESVEPGDTAGVAETSIESPQDPFSPEQEAVPDLSLYEPALRRYATAEAEGTGAATMDGAAKTSRFAVLAGILASGLALGFMLTHKVRKRQKT